MPKVSVIIPTYNRADLLPRAINSVLMQDYRDFELLVVDDGSTDETWEVVRGYNDGRVRCIRLPQNSGSSSRPRNVGIAASLGEYIALLDSDDEWLPSFLTELVAKMECLPRTVGVVYCGLVVRPLDGGRQRIMHARQRGKVWPDSLSDFICSMSSSVIRHQCFDNVGMFDETDIYQDHQDMVIRLSKAYEFDYVSRALAIYHYHAGQRTRILQTRRLKALRQRYAQDFKAHPVQNGIAGLTLGLMCLREGHKLEGLKYIACNLRYIRYLFSRYGRTNNMTIRERLVFAMSFLRSSKWAY